jgi:hypothetical protein
MVTPRQPARTMPLIGSVDRKTHPHLLQPPDFTELINVDLHNPGAIMKRRGYPEIGAASTALGTTLTSAVSMQAYKGSALVGVLSGNRYLYEDNMDDMASVGLAGSISATASHSSVPASVELSSSGSSMAGVIDYARCGDYEGLILRSGTQLIRNRETGATMWSASGGSYGAPRAITIGTVIYFVYIVGTQVTVFYRDTADFTGASVSSGSLNDADPAQHTLDVATDGTNLYIAYRTPAPGATLKVAKLTGAGVLSATATASADPDAMALFYSTSGFALISAWQDGTTGNVHVQGWDTALVAQNTHALATPTGDAKSVVIGKGTSSTKVRVYWTDDDAYVSYRECNLSGTTSGATQRDCYGVGLGSKPIRVRDTHDVIVLYHQGGTLSTTAWVGSSVTLARVTDAAGGFDPLCAIHVGSAFWPYPAIGQMVPTLCEGEDADELLTVTSGTGQVFGDGAPAFYVSRFIVSTHTGVYAEPSLYVRGGCVYDGSETSLSGFLWAPLINIATAGTVGSMTPSGTYSYIAIYEHTDANGTIHRSAPSPAKQVTLGAGDDSCSLSIRTLLWRAAVGADARIVIYRTAANRTVYYRLTAVGPTVAQSFCDTASTVAFVDTEADATLTDNEILYTQGGAQLPNYPMPAGAAMDLHDGRVWVAGDDGAVWYSKELLPYEGAAFNPALTIDTRGLGQPVALCGLETVIAFFWRNAIGYVYGQGPNDAGQGGSYTGIQLISGNTIGCSNPASVVRTPVGVMFESESGIYALPPGGGVPQFIGSRIEEQRAGEVIVGANVLQDRECVAFTCESGRILNFWYGQNRWSWDEIQFPDGEGERPAYASCISGSRHTLLFSSGLSRQADGVFYDEVDGDAGGFIPTTITTGWIALDGLQGLVRIWNLYLLGVRDDGCDAKLTVWADRDDSGSGDVYDWDVDAIQGTDGGPVEARAHCRTQQLKAMKLQIVDSDESGNAVTGQGMTFTGIRIDWGGTGKGPRLGRESAVV